MRVLVDGVEIEKKAPKVESPDIILDERLALREEHLVPPTLIVGSVGSGKTVFLRRLMDQICDRQEKDNVVIFCAKKSLLSYYRQGDIMIAVDSEAKECCWNIFLELQESDHPDILIREIGDILFYSIKNTHQPFYYYAPKQVFEASLKFLYDLKREFNLTLDNTHLVKFLTRKIGHREETDLEELDKEMEIESIFEVSWMELSQKFPEYFWLVQELLGGEQSDQAYGVLSEISTIINRVFFGSFLKNGGTLSITKLMKERGKRILLYYDYSISGSCRQIYEIILRFAMQQTMNTTNESRAQRDWYFVDEGSLLKINEFEDFLSYGREFGGRIIMVLQSALLMKKNYENFETILSLFPNLVMFRTLDSYTRKIMQDRLGKGRFKESYAGVENRETFEDNIISDSILTQIVNPGDAMIHMPVLSQSPFFYRGYKA